MQGFGRSDKYPVRICGEDFLQHIWWHLGFELHMMIRLDGTLTWWCTCWCCACRCWWWCHWHSSRFSLQQLCDSAALTSDRFWIASGLNVTAVLPGMLALSPMESSRRNWWHRTRWRVWFWCCLPELCHMARKVSDCKLHVGLRVSNKMNHFWILSSNFNASACAKVCNLQCSRLASDPEEPEIGCTSMVYECPCWKILGPQNSWRDEEKLPTEWEPHFVGESNFQRN